MRTIQKNAFVSRYWLIVSQSKAKVSCIILINFIILIIFIIFIFLPNHAQQIVHTQQKKGNAVLLFASYKAHLRKIENEFIKSIIKQNQTPFRQIQTGVLGLEQVTPEVMRQVLPQFHSVTMHTSFTKEIGANACSQHPSEADSPIPMQYYLPLLDCRKFFKLSRCIESKVLIITRIASGPQLLASSMILLEDEKLTWRKKTDPSDPSQDAKQSF